MSKSRLGRSKPTTDRVLQNIADETRREIVAVLRERRSPVHVEELAALVVGEREEESVVDGTEPDGTPVDVALTHVHLPALADADLVEWTSSDGTVTATDHPAYEDEQLRGLLSADADTADWEAVIRRLADVRRRHVVSVLEDGDGTIGRRALARRVAAREADEEPSDICQSTVDTVETSLYHTHIPALRRASLVDTEGETVTYDGHPAIDQGWLSIDLDGTDGNGSRTGNVGGTRAPDEGGASVEPATTTTVDEADD